MIVSRRKSFVFFAIPKTASSTIRRTLADFHDAPREFPPHTLPEYFFRETVNEDYSGLYRFTFVRNPYDRLFAQFLEREKHIKETETYLRNEGDFNRIVRNELELLNCPAFTRVWADFGYSPHHQMHYWTHKDNKLLVDFVGYQERFDRDFSALCERLDLEIEEIKNANIKSEIKPPCDPLNMKLADYKYLHEYEPETLSLVNERYRKDFELFGYSMIRPADLNRLPGDGERT